LDKKKKCMSTSYVLIPFPFHEGENSHFVIRSVWKILICQ